LDTRPRELERRLGQAKEHGITGQDHDVAHTQLFQHPENRGAGEAAIQANEETRLRKEGAQSLHGPAQQRHERRRARVRFRSASVVNNPG
jgi:hypothetical protein